MAVVPFAGDLVIYPKDKMHAPLAVYAVGSVWNPDLGIGGGPVFPPPGGGGPPDVIWPGPGPILPPGTPEHPWIPPGSGGPIQPPQQQPPYIPTPPTPPLPPGTPVPPPGGSAPYPPPLGGAWPVQPVVSPPYVVINYPGYGPMIVAAPAGTAPPPPGGPTVPPVPPDPPTDPNAPQINPLPGRK